MGKAFNFLRTNRVLMTSLTMWLLVLALGVSLFGGAAMGNEIPVSEEIKQEVTEILQELDANENGSLEADEYAQEPGNFAAADLDQDDRITRGELTLWLAKPVGAVPPARPKPTEEQLAKLRAFEQKRRIYREVNKLFAKRDRNRNGILDPDERGGSGASSTLDGLIKKRLAMASSSKPATDKPQSAAVQPIAGLPKWFLERDADGDNQVMMHEYTDSWTQEKLVEFLQRDLNNDGIITPQECLKETPKTPPVKSK